MTKRDRKFGAGELPGGAPRDKKGRKAVDRWPASRWVPNPERVVVKRPRSK